MLKHRGRRSSQYKEQAQRAMSQREREGRRLLFCSRKKTLVSAAIIPLIGAYSEASGSFSSDWQSRRISCLARAMKRPRTPTSNYPDPRPDAPRGPVLPSRRPTSRCFSRLPRRNFFPSVTGWQSLSRAWRGAFGFWVWSILDAATTSEVDYAAYPGRA